MIAQHWRPYFVLLALHLTVSVSHGMILHQGVSCSGSGVLRCGNGGCVPERFRCDGDDDCRDGTDEAGCPCSVGEFTCSNATRCIPARFRCDGDNNCGDNSDEQNCGCPPGAFQCTFIRQCILARWRCDGDYDCLDGTDERDCQGCSSGQFRCNSTGRCISGNLRCNGNSDCEDNSDEANCGGCPSGYFKCKTARLCVTNRFVCDGDNDCGDLSDEQGCNVTSTTRILSDTLIPDGSTRQTRGSSPKLEAKPTPDQNPRSESTTAPDAGDLSKILSHLLTSPILYGVGGAVVITAIVAITLCCIFARRRKRTSGSEMPMTIRSNPPTHGTLQTRNPSNPEHNHYECIPAAAYSNSAPKQEHAYLQPQLSAGTYIHAPNNDDYLKPTMQRNAAYKQLIDDTF